MKVNKGLSRLVSKSIKFLLAFLLTISCSNSIIYGTDGDSDVPEQVVELVETEQAGGEQEPLDYVEHVDVEQEEVLDEQTEEVAPQETEVPIEVVEVQPVQEETVVESEQPVVSEDTTNEQSFAKENNSMFVDEDGEGDAAETSTPEPTITPQATQEPVSEELYTLTQSFSDDYSYAIVVFEALNDKEITVSAPESNAIVKDEASTTEKYIFNVSEDGTYNFTITCGTIEKTQEVTVNGIKKEEVAFTLDLGNVYIGRTTQAKLFDADGNELTDVNVTWSIDDSEVATVDDNGNVTGVAQGETSLHATINGTERVVNVSVSPVKVTSVAISGYSAEYILVEDTVQLSTSVLPEDATDSSVIWSSSDTTKAIVDANGLVTAVGQGDVKIRAAANDESGKYSEITIRVYDGEPTEVSIYLMWTNNYQDSIKINIPSNGDEVAISSVVPEKVNGYVYTGTVKFGNLGKQPTISNLNDLPVITKMRYSSQNRSAQVYVNNSWQNIGSNIIYALYAQQSNSGDNSGVKVTLGDWPYFSSDTGNEYKNNSLWSVFVSVVIDNLDGSTKEVYTSGELHYDSGNAGKYLGLAHFNCENSIYVLDRVVDGDGNVIENGKNGYRVVDGYYSVYLDPNGGTYEIIAHIKPATFTITYNAGEGATNVPEPSTSTATGNEKIIVSTQKPEKEGYTFIGWEYNGSTYYGGEEIDMNPEPVVFEAKWQKNSETIYYTVNDSSMGYVTSSSESIGENTGSTTRGSKAIAKKGYHFVKWVSSLEGSEDVTSVYIQPDKKAATYTAIFEIDKIDISNLTVEKPGDVTYNGQSQQQKPVVKDKDGNVLTENVYYKLTYSEDTTNAGTVTVTVEGMGNYTGKVETSYEITKAQLIVVTQNGSKVYDGTALTAAGSVKGFVEGETYTFTVTGSQTAVGSSSNTYEIIWDGTAKESNYVIEESLGTLTVTLRNNPDPTPTPTVDPGYTPCPDGTQWSEEEQQCVVIPDDNPDNPTPTPTPNTPVNPGNNPDNGGNGGNTPDDNGGNTVNDNNANNEVVDVEEEETPLVLNGHWALINLFAALGSVLLAIILVVSKHEKDDEEDEDSEDSNTLTRNRRWKVISTIVAIGSVIIFVITENIKYQMVLVDKYTLLMVVLTLVNVASLYFGKKWHENDDEEEVEEN